MNKNDTNSIEKINRKTILLMNVILGQTLIVVSNGMWGAFSANLSINIPTHYITAFSLIAGGILSLAAVFLLKEIVRLSEKEKEAEISKLNLKKNEEFINVMRSQRHDFLNHIQVIYGLAQLSKTEKISSYIGTLKSDIETENMLGILCQSEFAAFLLRKKSSAIEKGIKFKLDIFTDLAHLKIAANELVSIAGNLIDNAFYAIELSPDSDSEVLLTIDEQDSNYIISVANTGPEIPEEIKLQMFKQGFTTKEDKGSGLGLYIVKELVEKNKGRVELVDEPGFGVCFQVKLPKNKA